MRPVECENKHFYDADRFMECPHCKEGGIQITVEPIEVKASNRKKHHFFFGRKAKKDADNRIEPIITSNDNQIDITAPLDSVDLDFNESNVKNSFFSQSAESTESLDEPFDEIDRTMALYDESELLDASEEDCFEQVLDSELGLTMMLGFEDQVEESEGEPKEQVEITPLQQAVYETNASAVEVDMKTVGFFNVDMQTEPVVGWLVCIFGKHLGESFVLKSGRNNIGRAYGMDISLSKETSVSRDRHAIITFEPIKKQFIIQAGESNGLTYINGELVVTYNTLKSYDTIRLGQSDFLFVALCSERFSWEKYLNA